ncbi:hypothetical protein OGAPHI_006454 [Ogataea philodendri]|uniref:proline--tRNA ligase n=1 Tax=Ogataea philodendri TaxID=1378263 RepID=A0A9P8T0M7_9ASCO|nr:uncharacterized protein OGAPHI_006454 [Ogataea philodendri]KAH3661606.1 hypothetical protein OGAPHI_006454 [Ogataea philodendri]
MIRRFYSTILGSSVGKFPKNTSDIPTTDLLIKLGFVSQPNSGLTHWLPLGLWTVRNIIGIIRKHHDKIGCQEVSLSVMSHHSLWDKTKRWQNDELFKVGEFCLAATAEEEITQLVQRYADSYKKLPIITYQIGRKYRNEKRPRGGLLRGREFIMKDAYSFDVNQTNALKSFEKMNQVYYDIFKEIKVPFVKANADSGDIGGDLSYEWHFVSEHGEDTLLECDACGVIGNIERVRPHFEDGKYANEAQVNYHLTKDGDLCVVYSPKGRRVNYKFLKEEDLVDFRPGLSSQEAIEIFKDPQQSEFKNIIRVMDVGVGPGTLLPDLEVPYVRSRMTTFEDVSFTDAQDGDTCSLCKAGQLKSFKGIEVGHTFYLGKKYSEALNAGFADSEGQKQLYEMGCYGIGVSRLVAAIAEATRDSYGLRWPASVAPVQLDVVVAGSFTGDKTAVDELVSNMQGVRVRVDDEDGGLGEKLARSKRIGIPLQLIVGKQYPQVEIEIRGAHGDLGKLETEIQDQNGLKKLVVDIQKAPETVRKLLSVM